jgi:KDO2-lipid IV(A) lauroyltransferase
VNDARRSSPPALPPAVQSLGQRVRAGLVALVSWVVSRLPEGFVLRVADLGGFLWYRTTPQRAALARRQLARVAEALEARASGPERARRAARDPRALERLVRDAYRHAARYYVEVMRTPRLDARYIRERVLIETPDVVEAAFAEPGPVIFVGAHFGAIELPALYLATRTGRPVTGPMETVGDPYLQRWFERTRAKVGITIVGLREARRELLAALRRGESVGLVADRDLTSGGLEVSLFGHPARLPAGPALLAVESGSPIYLATVRRDGPGRYRGRLQRIEVPTEGSRRERVTATVHRLAAAFEDAISLAPEQWWAVFFPIWPDLATASVTADRGAGATPEVAA